MIFLFLLQLLVYLLFDILILFPFKYIYYHGDVGIPESQKKLFGFDEGLTKYSNCVVFLMMWRGDENFGII